MAVAAAAVVAEDTAGRKGEAAVRAQAAVVAEMVMAAAATQEMEAALLCTPRPHATRLSTARCLGSLRPTLVP